MVELELATSYSGRSRGQIERRETILNAAVGLFHDTGYQGTTMDQIAAASGITKRTLYEYLGSKERVLYELQERLIARLEENNQTNQDPSSLGRLLDFIGGYLLVVINNKLDITVFFDEMKQLSTDIRKELIRRRDEFEIGLRKLIQSAISDGELRECDVALVSNGLLGALNGVSRWYRSDGELTPNELVSLTRALLIFGFRGVGSNTKGKSTSRQLQGRGSKVNPPQGGSSEGGREDWETNEVLRRIRYSAAVLFQQHGFASTSTSELATVTGLKKSILFYYIGQKEEVLFQIHEGLLNRMSAAITQCREQGYDGLDRLRQMIIAYCELVREMPADSVVVQEEMKYLAPHHLAYVKARSRFYIDRMQDEVVIAAAEMGLTIEHPNVVTRLLFGMLNDMHRWFRPSGRATADQVGRLFFDLFVDGLTSDKDWQATASMGRTGRGLK